MFTAVPPFLTIFLSFAIVEADRQRFLQQIFLRVQLQQGCGGMDDFADNY